MRTRTLKSLMTLAVAGACLGTAAAGRAQDGESSEGKARISDRKVANLDPVPDPGPGVLPVGAVEHVGGPIGRDPYLYGDWGSPIPIWLGLKDGCTYPPGYGFTRPVKRRMYNQVPVQYYRYWPDVWYGQPGAFTNIPLFPQVYTPTDTTQLGYTYQRVPTWQPVPGMLPPPPWPAHWHRRECPDHAYPYGAPYGVPVAAPIAAPAVAPPGPPPVDPAVDAAP